MTHIVDVIRKEGTLLELQRYAVLLKNARPPFYGPYVLVVSWRK